MITDQSDEFKSKYSNFTDDELHIEYKRLINLPKTGDSTLILIDMTHIFMELDKRGLIEKEQEKPTREQEKALIKRLYDKALNQVFALTAKYAAGLLIISLIPLAFLPRARSRSSSNLIQTFGLVGWLIFFIVVVTIIGYLIYQDKKVDDLLDDMQDCKKNDLEGTVVNLYGDRGLDLYSMEVMNKNFKKIKININASQYNNIRTGQKLKMEVYRNSKILATYRQVF